MIGFLIKKTLYDLWDNMLRIVLLNLGFIAVTAIPIFLPMLLRLFINSTAVEVASTALGIFLCSIYLAAAALTIKPVSDYGNFGFSDFFGNLKKALLPGIAMGLFVFFLFLVISIIIPYYLGMESSIGSVLAAIVFWVTIFAILSFQFYFSVYARLGNSIKKSFKKCVLISLDNTGLAIFLILHNIVVLLLSIFFAFMFPGPAGILLYVDEALRLRLLKYDWLEANPGANRKKIPWDVILIEEREKTGHRTFRNFVFPWRD